MVQRPTIRREQAVVKPSLGRQPFGAAAGGAAALQKSQTPSERNDTLRIASVARVEAVMGHDTAMLAAVVSDPIVAIVREPGAQLASSLAFRPKRLTRRGDAVLEALDINNVQTRSLSVADIPLYAPRGRQEYDHWLGLIDQLVNRFRLFRMTDRQSFIEYCKACPASAPLGQIGRIEQERVSGSS